MEERAKTTCGQVFVRQYDSIKGVERETSVPKTVCGEPSRNDLNSLP